MQKTIRQITRVGRADGEVGIEVEVEGRDLDFRGDGIWRREHDHSLKAAEAGEFVLRQPLNKTAAKQAVYNLYTQLKDATIDDSVRAGVHVHINVQELTPTQLATSLTAYYLLEKVLTNYCGEGRAGNLFCLRLCDAEHPLFFLNQVYKDKELRHLHTDTIRYAACNLKALAQYGSLEFRALKTPKKAITINRWIEMLHRVVLGVHDDYNDPTDLLAALSANGAEEFITSIVGADMLQHLNLDNLDQDLRDMVDIVQVFAYSHDWTDKKLQPNLNIFGTQPEEDW